MFWCFFLVLTRAATAQDVGVSVPTPSDGAGWTGIMLAVVLVVWELAKLAVTEAKVRLLGVPRGVGVEKKCPIEDVNFTLTQERLKEVHTVVMDRMPDSGIYRVWSGAAVERALTDALGALAVNIKATNDLVRKLDEYITEERQHAQR